MIIERYQMVDKCPTPDITEFFAAFFVMIIGAGASVLWCLHTLMWVMWYPVRKMRNLDEKNRNLGLNKEWDDIKKEER